MGCGSSSVKDLPYEPLPAIIKRDNDFIAAFDDFIKCTPENLDNNIEVVKRYITKYQNRYQTEYTRAGRAVMINLQRMSTALVFIECRGYNQLILNMMIPIRNRLVALLV